MRLSFIQNKLSSLLKTFGHIIGRQPLYFILFPCIISALLSTGILRMKYNRDFAHLFTAEESKTLQSRKIVESLFPINTSSNMDVFRASNEPEGVMVVATPKKGHNMLTLKILQELTFIDNLVKNFSVDINNDIIRFQNVCAINEGECLRNPIFKLVPHIEKFVAGKYRFKYPLDIDLFTFAYTRYIINLGGVTVDSERYVKSAKAIRLLYAFDTSNKGKKKIIEKWETEFIKTLNSIEFDHIDIVVAGMTSLVNELKMFTEKLFPLTSVVALIVAVFSMASCMTNSWVRSKPWLGVASCGAAGMAVISSFGALFLCGLETTDMNITLPFLILATEIDDAFVLISAWRRTSPKQAVDKRLGEAYSEAAVSITITSLTNLLSFIIGLTLPFPIVRVFCTYAATCIFFTYVYQITFFGGWMAVSGYREQKNLHPFTLRPVINPEHVRGKSSEEDNIFYKETIAVFFKEKLGGVLCLVPCKIIVVVLFAANLLLGIWGILQLKDGIDITHFLGRNSATKETVRNHYLYFSQFAFPLHIVINNTLNYADNSTQAEVEQLLRKFEEHPHTTDPYLTLSWLKYYKKFSELPIARFSLSSYNLSRKEDFLNGLRNVFLLIPPARQFENDLKFNEDFTEITATRYIVGCSNLFDRDTELKVLKDMQQIAQQSSFDVTVHSIFFPLLEHALLIRGIVFQLGWVVALLIITVFFLFIPDLICAICVSLAVVSCICETVGFMALWGINLDMVSLILLILSVGFSINYPTHVSFSFITSKDVHVDEKLKQALYEVGWPIIQGSVSTILGVLILAFQDSYVFSYFFKIVFLVSLETSFHALIVLPVLLSIVERCRFNGPTLNIFSAACGKEYKGDINNERHVECEYEGTSKPPEKMLFLDVQL